MGINTTSGPSYALDVCGETDTSILLKATGTTASDDTIFRNRLVEPLQAIIFTLEIVVTQMLDR